MRTVGTALRYLAGWIGFAVCWLGVIILILWVIGVVYGITVVEGWG